MLARGESAGYTFNIAPVGSSQFNLETASATAARVRPRDSLRPEHLDGNAGAVASRRAPPSVRGERAPRGGREATFGLLPSRSHSWIESELRRHLGLCAGRSHVHPPRVYRFAPQFVRAWREAGGSPLAVLVPSPLSGAEFEGRPGSSRGGFSAFWLSPRLDSFRAPKARPGSAARQGPRGFVAQAQARALGTSWFQPSRHRRAHAAGAGAASVQYEFDRTLQ